MWCFFLLCLWIEPLVRWRTNENSPRYFAIAERRNRRQFNVAGGGWAVQKSSSEARKIESTQIRRTGPSIRKRVRFGRRLRRCLNRTIELISTVHLPRYILAVSKCFMLVLWEIRWMIGLCSLVGHSRLKINGRLQIGKFILEFLRYFLHACHGTVMFDIIVCFFFMGVVVCVVRRFYLSKCDCVLCQS